MLMWYRLIDKAAVLVDELVFSIDIQAHDFTVSE